MTIAEEIETRQRLMNLIETEYQKDNNPAYLTLKDICEKQIIMLFEMMENKNDKK
jgi:hypothetical protein